MSVTRNDVAKLAGVSAATVSYVVNNGPRPVSAETRQKVIWAIEQLGYRPSAAARSLKTKRTYTCAIVISDILNPVLASIVKVLEDQLLSRGYSLTLCNSNESPDRELAILHMLLDRQADGIVLLPTARNSSLLVSMVETGQHLVLIDREVEGVHTDCVLFDNEPAAYEAVRHLIELGHSRIGLLGLPFDCTPGHGRLLGYERALREAGLPVIPELIREGSFTAGEGFLLAGELLDLSPPPTALFVANNMLAQGVLNQVKVRRQRMPEDLALVVFDDVGYYSVITPSITAVAADLRSFTESATQLLIDRVSGTYTGPPRKVVTPCHLIVRESTVG